MNRLPEQCRHIEFQAMDADDESIKYRAVEVHKVAKSLADSCTDSVTLFREIMGINGVVRTAFPTTELLSRFELTDEYADIDRMIQEKRELASRVRHADAFWLAHHVLSSRHASGVRLACEVGEFSPSDEVADELVNLCRAINALHIACGGDGVVIDDWEVSARRESPVGVL